MPVFQTRHLPATIAMAGLMRVCGKLGDFCFRFFDQMTQLKKLVRIRQRWFLCLKECELVFPNLQG